MLNILIPMAGRGSRFQEVGYRDPKPLIPVHGRPMVEWVIDNLRPKQPHRFIFLCLKEHLDRYPLAACLEAAAGPGSVVLPISEVTQGAACTALLAESLVDSDDPLMLANCDQWVDVDIDAYLGTMDRDGSDGLIMTFWADHPKWSYCRMSDGLVREVVEKQVISNEATVGIYNFARGRDFVWAAKEMIRKNLRVNGEFYVAPAYNQIIDSGRKVRVYNIGADGQGMYGLGTPADLEAFLRIPLSSFRHLQRSDMRVS